MRAACYDLSSNVHKFTAGADGGNEHFAHPRPSHTGTANISIVLHPITDNGSILARRLKDMVRLHLHRRPPPCASQENFSHHYADEPRE